MSGALRFLACAALLIVAGPARAATHFGLVDTGELFASTDAGVNWTLRSTLPVRDAVALIAGATSAEFFLASETGSFYRSTDAGMSWTWVSTVPASDMTALLSYPGRRLLLTRSGSVFSSIDNGGSFAAIGVISAPDLVSLARQGSSNFALTRTGTVYRSDDDGASWSGVGTITTSSAVEIVSFTSLLYALTETGDVARSNDAGASWSFVGTLSQVGMTGLLATSGELLATTEGGEIAASPDGVDWTWRGVIGQLTVRALTDDRPTTIGVPGEAPALTFAFLGPWPNPARTEATLAFELASEDVVSVTLYNAAGRAVARPLAGERLPAGRVTRTWRPASLPRGVYILRAQIGDRRVSRALVWLGGSQR